ncbi:ead/Ea22-like family protein [Raoultella planticola]|uniref:ead/Ea22-like family protein n=1 Tax=Raoultella planticola TaxID=575 RepID=UPI0025AAB81E|nr:ead/Ea22-like family protein [Raoultella planticola]
MTDITELALLVSKAKASVFTLEYISQFEPADIDSDDVDLRFEVDGRDTGTNVSIVDECGQAAKVIGTLVEALEKAQKSNEFLKGQLSELANFNPDWDKLEASYESWREIAAELLVAEERIAELESRTVTVKLPEPFKLAKSSSGLTYHYADEVNEALSAAGIKWEAE